MTVLCLSFAVALADQVTKHLVRLNILPHDRLPVTGFFGLSHVRNTGAAWGVMAGLNDWLVLLSMVMLALMVLFRHHFLTRALIHKVAMGLMIGGIVGNLVDRIRLGYVVDFLDFHYGVHHFPSFNIADSAICVGVGLYLLSQVILRQKEA